jgi:hypothetical protein
LKDKNIDKKESVKTNVEKVKNLGCEGEKIIVGISNYGKVYKLSYSKNINENEKAILIGDVEYYKVI